MKDKGKRFYLKVIEDKKVVNIPVNISKSSIFNKLAPFFFTYLFGTGISEIIIKKIV